ncbi:glycosyltransferase family 2 protein [Flavobacterium xanthum]|uniref:Glycosyltransferase involved in cell wall bisynthesis n=1 Tax=Flavobacterium xanthum TaxID=69322 RepID=A0A1M7BGE9_9FLAO|nr:glycosyltransferase family A protein [Flavobacterium xanthum]SHL54095.1 Glycosyltransferase involved in cell wall bisynthesis [Flavobacterium xanthum]
MNPLISIIIPSYNREKLISETLDSVLEQTYSNWECIIIDDRSTDGTNVILKEYSNRDNRFITIAKPLEFKQGASVSKNLGLQIARGEYIQFLDSDDILAKNKLAKQIDSLKNENEKVISVCITSTFKQINDDIILDYDRKDYRNFNNSESYFDIIGEMGGYYAPESFLISRALVNFSGYWNENLTLNDDGEFFFRIIYNSSKIIFNKDTFVRHREKTSNNLSMLNSFQKATSLLNSWKIIEILYKTKYNKLNSKYLDKKKWAVYNELKRTYPILIKQNNFFFYNQKKKDNLLYKFNKLKRRVKARLKIIFKY